MKKLLALFALLAVSSIPTLAQHRDGETPVFEVNGGYTYQRWSVPPVAQGPTGPTSLNFNGFNVGASYNITRWLAAAADITGTYNNQGAGGFNAKTHIYSYLFGPRIYPLGHHKLTPYVHALFGVATYNINIPADLVNMLPPFQESNNDFSFAVGGGVDWSVGKHFAVRLGQFDYQQTRFLHSDAVGAGLSASNQNNFIYSAGLVVRFGEK
ncbi:MAG TPA: outer membrane beta-barrel protein [Candidatus Limnocylindria bacterium]|nr:outer membrane beta-barrel protein [Candidatus Limnocylindria bacterium]